MVALIPDGPPRQFRWRGVLHQVAGAQGPERIAPEWWRRTAEATRDYYVVEDTAGRRFWLYRAGLYGRGGTPPRNGSCTGCWDEPLFVIPEFAQAEYPGPRAR